MDGGITGSAEVTTAAVLAMHGLPALQLLRSTDPEEVLMLTALAQRAVELDDHRQRSLARHIVNELGRAMKRRG